MSKVKHIYILIHVLCSTPGKKQLRRMENMDTPSYYEKQLNMQSYKNEFIEKNYTVKTWKAYQSIPISGLHQNLLEIIR